MRKEKRTRSGKEGNQDLKKISQKWKLNKNMEPKLREKNRKRLKNERTERKNWGMKERKKESEEWKMKDKEGDM